MKLLAHQLPLRHPRHRYDRITIRDSHGKPKALGYGLHILLCKCSQISHGRILLENYLALLAGKYLQRVPLSYPENLSYLLRNDYPSEIVYPSHYSCRLHKQY